MKKENNTPQPTESGAFKVAAFSADPDNALLLKLFEGPGDKYSSVALHDTSRQSGREDLLNIVEDVTDADVAITDFPSNSRNFISSIVPNTDDYFDIFKETGFKNAVVVPVTENPDAYAAAKTAFSEYGTNPTYVIAYQSTDANRNDYSLSRTQAMRKLVYERQAAGFDIIEFDVPRLSPSILTMADKHNIGYLDEALTQYLRMTDKIAYRDAVRRIAALLKELNVQEQMLNILLQAVKGGLGKTTLTAMIISVLRRADAKRLCSNQ